MVKHLLTRQKVKDQTEYRGQTGILNVDYNTFLPVRERQHPALQNATNYRRRREDRRPGLNNNDKPKVTVVVPAMNEELNLPHVLPRIPAWVDEIILVDGNSKDRTVEVARALVPDIVVVGQGRKGKGAALRAGFEAATGDIIVMIDADGSTDPSEIPSFVGTLLSGSDFVKGSRFMQGGGTMDMEWYRMFGNWGLMTASRLIHGGRFSDLCYGYAAFWRDVLPTLGMEKTDGFEVETGMNVRALRARLRVSEVASIEHRRIHGTSNLRAIPDGWRVLKQIVRVAFEPATKPFPKRRRTDSVNGTLPVIQNR
jgi:glycosyltransferase involved in cell wall biosynthesis